MTLNLFTDKSHVIIIRTCCHRRSGRVILFVYAFDTDDKSKKWSRRAVPLRVYRLAVVFPDKTEGRRKVTRFRSGRKEREGEAERKKEREAERKRSFILSARGDTSGETDS